MAYIKHSNQPARGVIDAFGGCRAVSRILKISPSAVSRWATDASAKGTGGRIPQRYWAQLLEAAQSQNLSLTVDDLAGL